MGHHQQIRVGARLAGVALSAGLLWLVFREIPIREVVAVLRSVEWIPLGVGFGLYGLALVASGVRWHYALHATRTATHFVAAIRSAIIGHFFFVFLFGAPGGDLAKAALYARWYRFSLAPVLAAAPLDRLLSVAGTLVLAIFTLTAAGAAGWTRGLPLELHFSVWTIVGGSLVAFLLVALMWRSRAEDGSDAEPGRMDVTASDRGWSLAEVTAFVRRTIRAFRKGVRALVRRPRLGLGGATAGLLAQGILSSVLVCAFLAVSDYPLDWAKASWTFIAVTVFSCLPFTVAGVGVRESAAVLLLGWYGVPGAEAVAAGLITLSLKLTWAGIAALVLAREQALLRKQALATTDPRISVVIPTRNEAATLAQTVQCARAIPEVQEIIVADAGSNDSTVTLARELGCRLVITAPGRGRQLRAGAALARGEVVLLLHADTWIPPHAGAAVLACLRDPSVVAGGFWKSFRNAPWLLKGSRWKCVLRLLAGRRIAGDQAMFVRRPVLEALGGVPDVELMEEFELCRLLCRVGRLTLADARVFTSARRFLEHGVLRTYARMWWVSLNYRLGVQPKRLAEIYNRKT